jgi:transcriptional regulator with XRE-family HTH domain
MTPKRKEPDEKLYSGRFAARLRSLREKAKLTPEQMAEAVGVSATTVYRWEADLRQPQISDLPTIADALGVKVRILLPEK